MSKRILISSLTVILLLVSIIGYGCPTPPRIPQRPEVRSVTHQWGELTSETAEIITTIMVYNPNPFVLPVKRVQTELFMAGIKVGQGQSQRLEMKTEGEFPINVSTLIQVEKIPASMWVEHLKQGEVSEMLLVGAVVFDLIITEFTFRFSPRRETLQTNLLGHLESILRKAEATEIAPFGENVPFRMAIRSISARWGEVTEERTELMLAAQVYNDSAFPITISRALAEATLNEMPLGDGRLAEEYQLLPNSETGVEIILALNNELMVELFMPRIENGEKAIFSLKASFVFDLPQQIATVMGKDSVEVLAYEVSGEFETGFLRDILGGTAR